MIPLTRVRPWLLSLWGLAVTAVFVAPYSVMLLDALRPSGDVLASPPTFLPRDWQLSTFGTVLADDRFLAWLKTSLLVAASSTVIVLLVAVPAAFFTARFRFPGRTAFLLRYTLSHPGLDTTIVGTLQPEHLQQNIEQAMAGPLPPDIYAEAKRRLSAAGEEPEH